MANKVYVGDIGTIITLDTGEDITSATTCDIKVRKGDGTLTTWTGVLSDSNSISYTILAGDLNCTGTYSVQAYIIMPSWRGLGETAQFRVYDTFE